MIELNKIYNEDCLEGMKRIPDKSVDAIVTDPPYKYLKHKLDRDWNEDAVFSEWNRILKDDGFIVMFGRGIPFYRWNVKLNELGFNFKEEIVWNKRSGTSPAMSIMRVHEMISIISKKGVVKRVKIPYLEFKEFYPEKMEKDIKRLSSALNNPLSLEKIKEFISNGKDEWLANAKPEKSITVQKTKSGDRAVGTIKSMTIGQTEQTIIEVPKDGRSKLIHQTQKPVRLMERLLSLVTEEGNVILDPFSGSGSTALACQNLNRKFIGFEIDKEYYEKSLERIKNNVTQLDLFDDVSE